MLLLFGDSTLNFENLKKYIDTKGHKMKIIAFGASTSKKSINKKLSTYTGSLHESAVVETLDLNDYELPIYSEDKEQEQGHPKIAKDFLEKLSQADGIIISYAEHNGSYTSAYKNLFDWCSRVNPKVYQGKNLLLLSTSPGARGGESVLKSAVDSAVYFDGKVVDSISVPSFYDNWDMDASSITNVDISTKLKEAVNKL